MDTNALWSELWNKGIPLFLLTVAVVKLWQVWREDTKQAAQQREENIKALGELKAAILDNSGKTADLTKSLSEFFLKHFP